MTPSKEMDPIETLTRVLHDAYESLAPDFGYTTREETREFKASTPNGMLMLAVVKRLADAGQILVPGYQSPNVFPWIFEQTPEQISEALVGALGEFGNPLSAVRSVFIENAPALQPTLRAAPEPEKKPVVLKSERRKESVEVKPAMFHYDPTAITIHVTGPNASGRSLVAAHIAVLLAHEHDYVKVRTVEGGMHERIMMAGGLGEKGPFKIIAPSIEIIDFCAKSPEDVAEPVTMSRVQTHQMASREDMSKLDDLRNPPAPSLEVPAVWEGESKIEFQLSDGEYIGAQEVTNGLIYFLGLPRATEILHAKSSTTDRIRTLGLMAELIHSMKSEVDRIAQAAPEQSEGGEPISQEHPRYGDWHDAVQNGDTLLGLQDWLEHNPEVEPHQLLVDPVCNQAITITVGASDHEAGKTEEIERSVRDWLEAEGKPYEFLTIQPYVEGRSGTKTKIDVFVELIYSHGDIGSHHNVEFTMYDNVMVALEERAKRLGWHFAAAIRAHAGDQEAVAALIDLFPFRK